jgi:hypothetical protein
MRRIWLRGRPNIHKRYLIHVVGHSNLSLLMRQMFSIIYPLNTSRGIYLSSGRYRKRKNGRLRFFRDPGNRLPKTAVAQRAVLSPRASPTLKPVPTMKRIYSSSNFLSRLTRVCRSVAARVYKIILPPRSLNSRCPIFYSYPFA